MKKTIRAIWLASKDLIVKFYLAVIVSGLLIIIASPIVAIFTKVLIKSWNYFYNLI